MRSTTDPRIPHPTSVADVLANLGIPTANPQSSPSEPYRLSFTLPPPGMIWSFLSDALLAAALAERTLCEISLPELRLRLALRRNNTGAWNLESATHLAQLKPPRRNTRWKPKKSHA